jgi:hypothetical protein
MLHIIMSDYVIAIPSYKRCKVFCKRTLQLIMDYKIPANKVYLFVANKEEQTNYSNVIPSDYKLTIVVGVVGMKNIRNFMTDYFNEGDKVMYMDDDLKSIMETCILTDVRKQLLIDGDKNALKKSLKLKNIKSLDKFIQDGFKQCEKYNTGLFGIYPASNAFFMKSSKDKDYMTTTLKYIIGSCYGAIIDKSLKVTVNDKEDMERTLQYFKKNHYVIRYNNITVKTNYCSTPGGMQVTRNNKRVLDDANTVQKQYPDMCSVYMKGKDKDFAEIRLKRLNNTFFE